MTGDEKIVYCLMRKIGDGGNFSENKDKKKLLENLFVSTFFFAIEFEMIEIIKSPFY